MENLATAIILAARWNLRTSGNWSRDAWLADQMGCKAGMDSTFFPPNSQIRECRCKASRKVARMVLTGVNDDILPSAAERGTR